MDLAPLYSAYEAEGRSASIEGFIDYLTRARVLDTSLLKELHTTGGVELPQPTDAALAGTQLAAWSQATQANGDDLDGVTTRMDGPSQGAAAASRAGGGAEERYQNIAVLGRGAMGAISLARDLYLRRKVALKTVLPEMAAHPQLLGRFLTEMQITAQLEHPNIVPIYALELGADGTLGYAMKLVQGRDLAKVIDEATEMARKGVPFDEEHTLERRIDCFLKVCDALEVAHEKGIVHRDLKPANIMVGRHNEVYLMDWGIARPMGAGGQALEAGIELHQADGTQNNDLSRTRLGSAIGTPAYMSPEQAEGRNADLDGRSDQYAMGLILQECVSLKQAVGGTTLQEILTKAKEARRDPVSIGNKLFDVPLELEAIVRKATQRDPKDRYPSIRALADDVRRYLRNEETRAKPDSLGRKMGRWISKHRLASLTLILGLGLVGAGATIGSLVVGQQRVAAAHEHELRVSAMETESAIHAQLVDRELSHHEAALAKLVGAAQLVLSGKTSNGAPPFFDADFAGKDTAPKDLAPAPRYGGKPVSVLSPVSQLAGGADKAALDPELRALGGLSPVLLELLLETGGAQQHRMTPVQQRDLVTGPGVPGLRARIALADGVTLTFPGQQGTSLPDARQDPIYKLIEETTAEQWGVPLLRGADLVLPLGAALFDDRPVFRGVAILEVSLDRLLEAPKSSQSDYVQSRLLVTRKGEVIAEQNASGGRAPLSPKVLAAIAEGKSGSIEHEEGGKTWLSTFYPLSSLDWYYVAIANVGTMMSGKPAAPSIDPRKIVSAAVPKPPLPVPLAAAPPLPPPTASAAEEPADAGAPSDAGPPADAGAPKLKGRMPVAPPPGPGEAPRNPFEKWKEYDKGGPK